MHKSRLEAYTDAVIAIVITIMVLEFKVPVGHDWASLLSLKSTFWGYILSFVFIAIYRNNHHHMFQAVQKVSGKVLWLNNLLLLFISLVPFTTAWMSESHFSPVPVMLYGIILLCLAITYYMIVRSLITLHGPDSLFAQAIGSDFKGKLSLVLYALGVGLATYIPLLSVIIYAGVALMRLIPDTRIEKKMR